MELNGEYDSNSEGTPPDYSGSDDVDSFQQEVDEMLQQMADDTDSMHELLELPHSSQASVNVDMED